MDFFNNLKNPAHTPFDGLWFIGEGLLAIGNGQWARGERRLFRVH